MTAAGMDAVPAAAATPWARGRLGGSRLGGGRDGRLMFAHMYEDHGIEVSALAGCRRILAIASAGDTALALAQAGANDGVLVTAIDINAAQVAHLRSRLIGGAAARGQAERIMAAGRGLLRVAGWHRSRMERFCDLDDPGRQVDEWRRLTAGLSGRALRALLAPAALGTVYLPAFAQWAPDLGRQLPGRIERGLARHPNRGNPWARLLFLGEPAPAAPFECRNPLTLVVGDVAAHLEATRPGTYDGFALSNVLDGAPRAYRDRLLAALSRSAPPEAPVVLRTLGLAGSAAASVAATADRALIWGGVDVMAAGAPR